MQLAIQKLQANMQFRILRVYIQKVLSPSWNSERQYLWTVAINVQEIKILWNLGLWWLKKFKQNELRYQEWINIVFNPVLNHATLTDARRKIYLQITLIDKSKEVHISFFERPNLLENATHYKLIYQFGYHSIVVNSFYDILETWIPHKENNEQKFISRASLPKQLVHTSENLLRFETNLPSSTLRKRKKKKFYIIFWIEHPRKSQPSCITQLIPRVVDDQAQVYDKIKEKELSKSIVKPNKNWTKQK